MGHKINQVAPATECPVFFDTNGKRWRRVLIVLCVTLVAVVGSACWIVPQSFAPVWRAPLNQANEFPRRFLDAMNNRQIPVIGDVDNVVLARIVQVKHDGDSTELTDPFTGEPYHIATDEEKKLIGNSPFAIEHFGHPADHQLMLTFDDGPDAIYTPQILDILAREHVPATFFSIGRNILKNPEVFKRIISEGHMVGNHTLSHIDFGQQSNIRNREELISTDRIIRAVGQYATKIFRIPRADPDHNALALLQAQQLGYLHVDMDIDTLDWQAPIGQSIPLPRLDGHGHVVLMHDGGNNRSATVALLSKFIAEAKQQGYTFSTVESLLPEQLVPAKDIAPSIADIATLRGLQLIWVLPSKLLSGLFWLGVTLISLMSSLYLTLALISFCKERPKKGDSYSDYHDTPIVSVVLAAYNEEKVIHKTLSALRQSDYPESKLEVVVVNDGSSDKTGEILNEFALWWPQLHVIHQPNRGKSVAINNGVMQARSESTVIVTLDGDTIFERDTIQRLVRHFTKSSNRSNAKPVGAVAGHVKVGNRRNLLTACQSLEYISGTCVTRLAEESINAIAIVPGACSAWNRSALQEIGGLHSDTLAEDADATLQLHRKGYRVLQESTAIAHTEAPETVGTLAKQRLRWTYGNIQVLWKHRKMLLRPKYGMLGMVALPHSLLSLLVPLLFLPLIVFTAITSVAAGNWQNVALFAGFVMLVHFLIAAVAIAFAHERSWHLLIIPIYRLIYEPLRAYLLYASLMRILKGRAVGWNKLERLNSVAVKTAR